MSVPKRRRTKARRNRGKRSKQVATAKKLVKCTKCSASITPHRTCPKCGYYKGREVVDVMKKAKKDKKKK